MEEKRKSPRVRANAVVSFKVKSAKLASGSRVKDISESGIGIPLKQYYSVNSILELEVRSDDLKEPIKATARVVRIANRDKGKFQFEVGVELLDFPFAKLNILHDYIQRIIAQGEDQDISWLD